jgi:N-glycosylase/DNA lyase
VRLVPIQAPDFDLARTLDSGQVFHWEKMGEGFVGMIGDEPFYVEQRGEALYVDMEGGAPATPRMARSGSRELAPPFLGLVSHYFALDHPLPEICASFPNDHIMNAARDFCAGLRIIRQPKWECLATFICSSMKQVAHIRQISKALRQRFGTAYEIGGRVLHSFPSPARLAESSERELQKCALGYRAQNLLATARRIASETSDLQSWAALPDDALREKLCELPGVGPKIANCVMLFAYERLRAFPIDVWIERVLREKYGKRRWSATRLRAFSENYFGEYGGYAQQYLFHHVRTTAQ